MITEAERLAMARVRELLQVPGERAAILLVVRPVVNTRLVRPAIVNASAEDLRAAAEELNRLADEREQTPAAPIEQPRPHYWWLDHDDC